jgi:LytS/YehU family sensor histidine kinase
LFNSLNSASLLTLTEPEKAHEMIVALSEYLRYSISGNHQALASLSTELDNAKRYLGIEKIRFGERLEMNFQLDEICLDLAVPTMILQPLYENAIKHGVYEATTTVWINTIVERVNGFLRVEITNSFQPGGVGKKGAGLGIRNVRERLRMIYGVDQAWLQTEKFDTMFVARLSIPARKYENPVDR